MHSRESGSYSYHLVFPVMGLLMPAITADAYPRRHMPSVSMLCPQISVQRALNAVANLDPSKLPWVLWRAGKILSLV